MKSVALTNSGRLISLVSSEIFAVENQIHTLPVVVSAPFINIACYLIIGFYISWWYTLSSFLLWLLIFVVQYLASRIEKRIKKNDGDVADNRI